MTGFADKALSDTTRASEDQQALGGANGLGATHPRPATAEMYENLPSSATSRTPTRETIQQPSVANLVHFLPVRLPQLLSKRLPSPPALPVRVFVAAPLIVAVMV